MGCKSPSCTVLAGFNKFAFNESSRFNESVLTSKGFLLQAHSRFIYGSLVDKLSLSDNGTQFRYEQCYHTHHYCPQKYGMGTTLHGGRSDGD